MRAQLFASALRRRAEFRVSRCELKTPALLHAVCPTPPNVALLALNSAENLAENMGIVRQFHLAYPDILKIFLVESSDRGSVIQAFRAGARGIFCITEGSLRILHKCILSVAAGQIWASAEELNYLVDLVAELPSLRVVNSNGEHILTPREEQVVAQVAEGLGNREIARELSLSEHTVKKYLFHIFEKLGISTRVELVLYAVNHGQQRSAEPLMAHNFQVP
jgi:DNA-binding NarL/FixJ family response regulator